ncbi:MAG TPA: DUF4328 domain-containing protein [Pyrinomonadaceae bacterium]
MTYTQFQQPPSAPHQYKPFVSAHNRARLVTILLIVGAVISLLTIPSHVLDLSVQPFGEDQEISDNPAGFLALALTGVLGLITIAVYIATVVVFLMWLYRVSNNVAAFGQPRQTSAGWAVGSFFVPIANLFIPYQAIKEIWQKSDPTPTDAFSYVMSAPGFFPAWWGFWLASNITSNIYFRMTMAEAPVEGSAMIGIFSEVLSIAAAAFAIQVVKEIDRRQEERARNLQQVFPAPPPPPVFEHRESVPAAIETSTANPQADTSPLAEPLATSDLPKPPDPANPQD